MEKSFKNKAKTNKSTVQENLPLYLFHQGTNYRAYDYMGAHFEVVDGKMGVGKKYRGTFERVLNQYINDKLTSGEVETEEVLVETENDFLAEQDDEELKNEINQKYSIISVGKNNRYGHPNDIVLDNLKQSKIYRTDQDGSIMFKIKNDKLEINTCPP